MINLLKIIENDDLDSFISHFHLNNWKETITTIPNYAGISKHTPTLVYDNCDCFKYSLHCNSDKIFNYLLPLVDTNKHGENYGWPLLAMAIKNERYDYANSIINHHSFNPYPRYHTNSFGYIETRPKIQEHIDFLFNYLKKFDYWDFLNKDLIYTFNHLICYNEDTFIKFDNFYKQKSKKNISVLSIYSNNMEILADEVINRKYSEFILNKLSDEDLKKMIESVMTNLTIFMPLFESDNAKNGLNYLLKFPDLMQKYIDNNQVCLSYLPLDCLQLLIKNNIDIWKENDKKVIPLDYILDNSNLDDQSTLFFINNYTQKIYDRLEKEGKKSNIKKYCHQKLLNDKLPAKNIINTLKKI